MSVSRQFLRALVLPLLLVPIPACGDGDPVAPPQTPAPGSRLAVDPASASLLIGETVQFRATGPLAGSGSGVYGNLWTSSDAAVIRVTSSGEVTATGLGTAYVMLSRAGVHATSIVTVSARR